MRPKRPWNLCGCRSRRLTTRGTKLRIWRITSNSCRRRQACTGLSRRARPGWTLGTRNVRAGPKLAGLILRLQSQTQAAPRVIIRPRKRRARHEHPVKASLHLAELDLHPTPPHRGNQLATWSQTSNKQPKQTHRLLLIRMKPQGIRKR